MMAFSKDEPFSTYVSLSSGLVLYEKESPGLMLIVCLLLLFPGQLKSSNTNNGVE